MASNQDKPAAEKVPAEPEDDGPSAEEVLAAQRKDADDQKLMQRLLDSDALLAAAYRH